MNEGMDAAARLGALGIDPLRFLNTKDDFERNMMLMLGDKILKQKQILDHNLAVEIASAVGKLFKS
jgi:hypothetical protein